ncbi:MAG TPA: hypothetical protein VG889_07450 [Rhizomicrobium sp.]|nr:hypothetical protein [Rhizomicrobium sp.]
MDQVLKWGGRVVIVIAGIIAIATGANPPHIAAIVTGVCAIGLAVYATIRDLAGTIEGEDDQIVGLVSAKSALDWIVFAALVVIVVVIWVWNP